MTTAPSFRYYGITDDTTTCDHCGREDLKRVVILMALDAEGNEDGLVYFGTTCAARALAARYGVKVTRANILREAEAAEYARRQNDKEARRLLAVYGIPTEGPVPAAVLEAAAVKYADAHRAAAWARTANWTQLVLDMVTRRRAQLIGA